MNTENTYTAVENGDGSFTLYRNGVAVFCPKTSYPVPIQGALAGQMNIAVTKFNCATNCPFAEIQKVTKFSNDDKDKFEYHIKCEGRELIYKLDKLLPSPKLQSIKN